MKCSECGAAIKRGDGRFCSHCGAALPDQPRISPEEWITHPERFAEVEASPALAAATAAAAPTASRVAAIPLAIFLVAWVGIGGVVTMGFGSQAGPLFLAPLAMVGVGVVMVLGRMRSIFAFAAAPVERRVAVVIDERTEMSGGGENSSVTTTYYATLQDKDGARREHPTFGHVAGRITRGDIGVAVLRADSLIAFHVIEA